MKSAPLIALIGILVFAGSYSGRAEVDEDPVVTIAPKRVMLLPTHKWEDFSKLKTLDFTITNRTAKTWRVSRFWGDYCWGPVLFSESGGCLEIT